MNKRYIFLIAFFLGIFQGAFTFSQSAQRVISLAPSLTKNIYFLEAQDKLVGCTSYCEVAKDDHKEIVASAVKVNLEKIISLKPDLVIASSLTNPETVRMLEKLGVKVESFPTPKSFDEICEQFIRLSKLIGKENLANSIVKDSKEKVDSLSKLVDKAKHPKVFFQIGAKPLFTVLPNTFMDDYIIYAGGVNIANDLTKGTMTRESVLVRNPDVIFIVTMGIVGEEEKELWESYPNISATKNRKIFIIDSDMACTPTPITFTQALEEIILQMK